MQRVFTLKNIIYKGMIMRGCQSLVRVNLQRLVGDIQLHSPLRQNARHWSVRGAPIEAPRAENPIWKEHIHFHQSHQQVQINPLEEDENKNQQNNSHNMNLLKEFLDIGNDSLCKTSQYDSSRPTHSRLERWSKWKS